MNLNAILSLFNLFQLRGIRSDLAKLTARQAPMPEIDLRPEIYESYGVQGPPPKPEAYRGRYSDAEWKASINDPARSEQGRSKALNDYFADKAMSALAETPPEEFQRMVRRIREVDETIEKEKVEAAICALELKYDGNVNNFMKSDL
jgi:hypothetical protein